MGFHFVFRAGEVKGRTEMKSSYFYFSSNYTQKKIRYQYLTMKGKKKGGRQNGKRKKIVENWVNESFFFPFAWNFRIEWQKKYFIDRRWKYAFRKRKIISLREAYYVPFIHSSPFEANKMEDSLSRGGEGIMCLLAV